MGRLQYRHRPGEGFLVEGGIIGTARPAAKPWMQPLPMRPSRQQSRDPKSRNPGARHSPGPRRQRRAIAAQRNVSCFRYVPAPQTHTAAQWLVSSAETVVLPKTPQWINCCANANTRQVLSWFRPRRARSAAGSATEDDFLGALSLSSFSSGSNPRDLRKDLFSLPRLRHTEPAGRDEN